MAAPGVMIAQAMGRWGNFFNGEAYGYQIGDTTRFFFFNKELILTSGEGTIFGTFRMGLEQFGNTYYYHPTFLYESVWNIVGFILANVIYKHKRFHGQIALFYFTWYGFGRMFIEGFRTDSLYVPGTGIRISQLLGLVCFIGAGAALLVLTVLTRKRERLLVLEDAAFEAAKKLEAELAEGDVTVTETKTEMQKLKESVAALWQKILKLFSKKEAGEKEPQAEEKNDGNEN
jgi:phosphatidylglycerol:prolipoprotein diacylglycerol transferase